MLIIYYFWTVFKHGGQTSGRNLLCLSNGPALVTSITSEVRVETVANPPLLLPSYATLDWTVATAACAVVRSNPP